MLREWYAYFKKEWFVQAEGVVVRSEAGFAHVRVQRKGSCGRCHEPGGCGAESKETACGEYRVENGLNAAAGDRVLIEVPEGATLRAAVLAYVLPLAGVLLGAGGAYALWFSDAAAVLGAGLGLVLALGLTRILARHGAGRVRIAGVLPS